MIVFYKYLFQERRKLLLLSLTSNFALPFILETLAPWWLSRRKIATKLRERRNKIQHGLVQGLPEGVDATLLSSYVVLSALSAALQVLDSTLRNRTALANRLAIKRLVFHRLLHSDLGSFSRVRTSELETRLMSDINSSIALVNYSLPALVGLLYTMLRDSAELLAERSDHIDALAVLRPAAVGCLSRLAGWAKWRLVDWKHLSDARANADALGRLVSCALEGLPEIQLNGMQSAQLSILDRLAEEELEALHGPASWVSRLTSAVGARGLADLVSEVLVAGAVMRRRGVSHEQYQRVQIDVDHILQLARHAWSIAQNARRVLANQGRLRDLMRTAGFFADRSPLPPPSAAARPPGPVPFDRIAVRGAVFAYDAGGKPKAGEGEESESEPQREVALDLSESEIVLERGRAYALVGRNRSGKSTLCALLSGLYSPSAGELVFEGREGPAQFEAVGREAVRGAVVYVSQRPYLFPGTVRDNILVGDPAASHEEVLEAAKAAGVLTPAGGDPSIPPVGSGLLFPPSRESSAADLELPDDFPPTPAPLRSRAPALPPALAPIAPLREDRRRAGPRATLAPDTGGGLIDEEAQEADAVSELTRPGKALDAAVAALIDRLVPAPPADGPASPPGTPPASPPGPRALSPPPARPPSRPASAQGLARTARVLFADGGGSGDEEEGARPPRRSHSCPDLAPPPSEDDEPYEYRPPSPLCRPQRAAASRKSRRTFRRALAHRRERERPHPASHPEPHLAPHGHHPHPAAPPPPQQPPPPGTPPRRSVASRIGGALRAVASFFREPEEWDVSRPAPSLVRPAHLPPHPHHEQLDAPVSARGANISGGFAQSIALARAYLRKNAGLLILDEAFSQMDPAKRARVVIPALLRHVRDHNMALLLVSHDLPSVRAMDRIFVLSAGKLAAAGSHGQLVAGRCEPYLELLAPEHEPPIVASPP